MSSIVRLAIPALAGIACLVLVYRYRCTQSIIVKSRDEFRRDIEEMSLREVDRIPISLDLWWSQSEHLSLPFGHIQLLNEEYTDFRTSMFSLVSDPTKVLIYRQICIHPLTTDKLLVDFWFLKYLQATGSVPGVHDISRALDGSTLRGKSTGGKVGTLISCRDPIREHPTIRYTIMDRAAGVPLHEYIPYRGGVPNAVLFGIRLIQALERIHQLNAIHGDLHPGNIMVGPDSSVQLIDFERATIFGTKQIKQRSSPDCDKPPKATMGRLHIGKWTTIWESQGCARSFRDDMFQALIAIACLVHGLEYIEFQVYLSENAQEYSFPRHMWVAHRSSAEFVFNVDTIKYSDFLPSTCIGEFLISEAITEQDVAAKAGRLFREIASSVLSLGMIDRPDYARLIALLGEIQTLTNLQ